MHFIYLTFTFLTIMFLSLLFVLGVKKNISSDLQFCIGKTTEFQRAHRKITNDLLRLNLEAAFLRASRKAAEVAVLVAPLPPAKAAAKAALELVKFAQKTFVVYQQYLLNKARFVAIKFQGEMFLKKFYSESLATSLVVEPYPENSDSPSYRLKDKYQSKKSVRFHKYIDVTKGFPRILKSLPLAKPTPHLLKCGATLSVEESKKGGRPSDIKLILDK